MDISLILAYGALIFIGVIVLGFVCQLIWLVLELLMEK